MAVHFSTPVRLTTTAGISPRLISRVVRWHDVSLLDFLRCFPSESRIYWRGQTGAAYAGIGTAAVLRADSGSRFDSIRQQARQLFDGASMESDAPDSAQPRLYGGFSYDADFTPEGIWSVFPAARFILPRYQLTHVDGETWLTVSLLINDDSTQSAETMLNSELRRLHSHQRPPNGTASHLTADPQVDYLMPQAEWHRIITEATIHIRHADLQKVVLARAAEAHAAQPIDPIAALAALDDRYPECIRFLIEPAPGHAFFGATPELLAQVDAGEVATIALAGSIRRGVTPNEDEELGRALLANPKERHEHALVTDSIRRSLEDLTTDLHIDAQPSVRHLRNIQHLRTEISGRLAAGLDALHIVEALHPTPALGGWPRQEALGLIAELESLPRGWYGAPIGWIDAEGNGTFAVAIRSAVSVGNVARLYAGAGIMADSTPDAEWQETAMKFRPLLDALSTSSNGNRSAR
jgi:menaquinone-specific isochorismate synthase